MCIMQEVHLFTTTFAYFPEKFRHRLHIGYRVHKVIGRFPKTRILKVGLLREVEAAITTLLDPNSVFFRTSVGESQP